MKFLRAFFAAFFVVALIYGSAILFCIDAPIPAEYWVAEVISVKKELARQQQGKQKIIIAGGSSSLFGIHAEQAARQLNLPVINFGLHAGMKLERVLQEVVPFLEAGDVLILPLEPSYYGCNSKLTSWQVTNVIGWDHAAWKAMPIKEKIELLTLVSPSLLKQMVQAKYQQLFSPELVMSRLVTMDEAQVLAKFRSRPVPGNFAYSAYNLNNHGDLQLIDGARYQGPGIPYSEPSHVCSTTATYLESFAAAMKKRGVQVYFANTPYIQSDTGLAAMRSSEAVFNGELAHIGEFIEKRENLVFERRYFLDAILHLNEEGRALRTELFVQSLKKLGHANAPVPVKSTQKPDFGALRSLPVLANTHAATKPVLWIDYCNDVLLHGQGKIPVDKNASRVILVGWAIDPLADKTADRVFVQAGDVFVEATYGIVRTSVSDYFKNPRLMNSGFRVTLNSSEIENMDRITFHVISHDKAYQYTPIEFSIERK